MKEDVNTSGCEYLPFCPVCLVPILPQGVFLRVRKQFHHRGANGMVTARESDGNTILTELVWI